jgi:hypothetical protein
MLWLAPTLPASFEDAEAEFRKTYPEYAPNAGIREFARIHWRGYHSRKTATGSPKTPAETSNHVDTARKLWLAFVRNLESRPGEAVELHISSIVSALEAAGAASPEAAAPAHLEID